MANAKGGLLMLVDAIELLNDSQPQREFRVVNPKWRWIECLGRGANIVVHRYLDRAQNYAVKFLPTTFGNLPPKDVDLLWEQRENELREFALLGRHPHPRIAQFHSLVAIPNWIAVVFEMTDLGLYHFMFRQAPRCGETTARRTMQQIMAAVNHMHALGLAHRAITIENVMVANAATLEVKLLHMGVAGKASKKMPAPDVLGDAFQTDMWFCGALLFLLIFGCFYAHDHPWRDQTTTTVHPSCADVLDALLTSTPSARPSAAEAADLPWLKYSGHARHVPHSKVVVPPTDHDIRALIVRARA